MPNILLTDYCNRNCPYCFAGERLRNNQGTNMPFENFTAAVDFLVDSGENEIILLGGEPTLHPQFVAFHDYLLDRGLRIMTFTNGCTPTKVVDQLSREFVPERTHFVVNVNSAPDREAWETAQQDYFFRRLGRVSGLGFNMYRRDLDLGFLFDYIERYGLRPHVRIGLAHPTTEEPNAFLPPEDFHEVQSKIAAFVRMCDDRGATVMLDCGFTLCGFDDEELGTLVRAQTAYQFGCGPLIDIGPDLTTWSCFPLSNIEPVRLTDFANLAELRRHFRDAVDRLVQERDHAGVFPECSQCRYRHRGTCTGGCMAHALRPNRTTDGADAEPRTGPTEGELPPTGPNHRIREN